LRIICTSILLLILLTKCKNEEIYTPENEKFSFPRGQGPFRGKVKSVTETKIKSDTNLTTKAIIKSLNTDEYSFTENGLLLNWKSDDETGVDLKYSSDVDGSSKTNFVSEKLKKREIKTWSQEDTFHILTQKTTIDDNASRTTIKKYNSSYSLLSVEEISPAGEINTYTYHYLNGRLAEVSGNSYTTKYSYGRNIDTSRDFMNGKITTTIIKFRNSYGDPDSSLMTGDRIQISESCSYIYDDHKNWTLRNCDKKAKYSGEHVVTRREIKYY